MISNTNLVLYACVAKGSTIVAEFSREPGLAVTAQKCVEKTPPHHSMFSHTVRRRTYTFLIEDPFTYFAIFDDDLDRAEGLWFLNRTKQAFLEKIGTGSSSSNGDLAPGCFQVLMDSFFCETLMPDFDPPAAMDGSGSRNPSMNSTRGKNLAAIESLMEEKPNEGLTMKKKKPPSVEMGNGNDHHHKANGSTVEMVDSNGNVVSCRDFPVQMHKNAPILFPGNERLKAKQVWKRHVWVVLMLDLFVCSVLFGIWLWVCRGLQCIDG